MITLNLYRDKKRQFRWRVRASNGEVMANGAGDGYQRRRDLDKAICRVFGWECNRSMTTIGQLMSWNRDDMKLEDETLLSHTMKAAAPKVSREKRPGRQRTPAKKLWRKINSARKRREAEAVRISKLAGRKRVTPKRLAATFGAKLKR